MSSRAPATERRQMRLRLLLASAFVLAITLPVFALALIPPLIDAGQARQQLEAQLASIADSEEAALRRWAASTQDDLREIADNPVLRPLNITLVTGGAHEASYDNFMAFVRALTNPFENVMLADLRGGVQAASHPELRGLDVSGETWFKAALESQEQGRVAISGPQVDPASGEQSLYFSMLIFDYSSEVVGVLGARASMGPLEDVLALIPPWAETADVYLMRAGQQVVVPPRLAEGEVRVGDDAAGEALAGRSGAGTWQDYRGEQVTGVYRWIEPLNVALVVKQDVAELTARSRAQVRVQMLVGLVAAAAAVGAALFISERLTAALGRAGEVAGQIAEGELGLQVPGSSLLEVNQLAEAVNNLTARLRETITNQEAIIASRTRELAITARMGQAIASETDLDRLLQTTIDLIRDQLGYYHAQVFLLDDLQRNAVLRASMGEAGQVMLARAHKLAVGSPSVVGQAAERREPVLASDTRHAQFWRPNPLLPDTRAELALPVLLGERSAGIPLGVLDIQATDPDVFDEGTIAVLETVADQLAVAIRNAQLLEEQEGLLSASAELTQLLTHEGWDEYARQRRGEGAGGFEYDLQAVRPVDGSAGEDTDANGHDSGQLRLPIALRGAVIGEVTAELDERGALSEDEQQLVDQLLERVALAIDNARLIEQTQLSLHEANRLYQAAQSITTANSAEELSEQLLDLAMLDTVDRALLLLVDSAPDAPSPWVRVAATRFRHPDDPLHDLPERLRLDTHPLLMNVENIPVGNYVLNGVDDALLDPAFKQTLQQFGTRSMATFAVVTPITGQDTLGWLILHSTGDDEAFSDADVRYLETVVDQAATALEGLRLFEQTRARARRLQATNEVSRAASSILNPDVLLPLVVDRISEAFGYYHVQVFLVDAARQWAALKASTGEVGQELLRRGHGLAVGSRSVIGQATATGEPVIIGDIDRDPVHRRNELLPHTRSEMALPLIAGERVIGALDVQSTGVDTFDPDAQAILQSLADQIAVTLENATLFQEIQDRVAELTTVNLVSQTVSRTQTLDELYEVVSDQMMTRFGARDGYLAVAGEDGQLHLPIFIEDGVRLPSPAPVALGEGLPGYVMRTRETLLLDGDVEEQARQLGLPGLDSLPKSVLTVPLALGAEVMGVLSLYDAEREGAFDEAHVRQLTTLAAYIAVKIRNAELLEQAQQRADELGFLFDVTQAAVAHTDLGDALTGVADTILSRLHGAESATFFLAGEGGRFDAVAAVGYGRELVARGLGVEPGEGLVGAVALTGQSLLVGDAREATARGAAVPGRSRALLAVPLKSGRQAIGVLAVESSQPGVFDADDVRLLEGASNTLTAVIQNAQLLEEISRSNEQLRELDMLKSQFLANMSHELRTPLNSIIGFSRVILKGIDGPLTDLQEQDLTTIYNSGQHLLGLINSILDLSKIEAGKMEIQPQPMDLVETIDTAISTGRGLVKDKPIEIVRDVEDGLPEVYADPMRVRQVLLNLMSNAAKFTEQGSITLRARRWPYDRETGEPPRVQLDVSDTGIGISQEDMYKLFQAFSQVDGSTTRQVGGTGLGLTISKEFIEMMGGRIWVESELGVGSTFSFTLPLYPPGAPGSEVVVASEPDGDRPLVLAVDDEPGVLDLYARYLEEAGYGIIGLNNAVDLVQQVREVRPAAVLLDLNLPGKSGWEALAELQASADTASVPVIVCSIDEEHDNGFGANVAEYLVKPVIEEDLLGALERIVAWPPAGPQDVLLLDADEAFAADVAAALAGTLGCGVRWQATGLAGLEALHDDPPDALVLDVDLPDMDGYGLVAALRAQSRYERLPVLIVSARHLPAGEIARLDERYTRYVHKGSGLQADLPALLAGLAG